MKRRIIPVDDKAKMRQMRHDGATIKTISREFGWSHRSVYIVCFGVEPKCGKLSRAAKLSSQDIETIKLRRLQGEAINKIAYEFSTSSSRIYQILGGIQLPNVREKLLADMRTARVPITPPNVSACSGHSRAWMRLYALRLLHPLLCEAGEPENAVSMSIRYR